MPDTRVKMSAPTGAEIEIDPELLKRFESIPDAKGGQPGFQWTPELDAILLKYWKVKRQPDVAREIGACVSTCRSRYLALTS